MSDIVLHPTGNNCITCVSNAFIDDYMVDADGEYVKIYLYLLRCVSSNGMSLSVSSMADALDHTQKDIKKALYYWERRGLLSLGFDDTNDINDIFLLDPMDSSESSVVSDTVYKALPEPSESVISPSVDNVPSATVTPIVDERAKGVLYMAETLLGHPLTPDVINNIFYWHDNLNLSWNLIEHIIESCVENGTSSISYMNKKAIGMSEDNITTVEEAKHESSMHNSYVFAVKKAFGISGRGLAEIENRFLDKWSKEYGFPSEIIACACGRTILKTQKASFDYADSILKNWFENGVKSMEDIDRLDKSFTPTRKQPSPSKRVHNFPERDTDFSSVEKALLRS